MRWLTHRPGRGRCSFGSRPVYELRQICSQPARSPVGPITAVHHTGGGVWYDDWQLAKPSRKNTQWRHFWLTQPRPQGRYGERSGRSLGQRSALEAIFLHKEKHPTAVKVLFPKAATRSRTCRCYATYAIAAHLRTLPSVYILRATSCSVALIGCWSIQLHPDAFWSTASWKVEQMNWEVPDQTCILSLS